MSTWTTPATATLKVRKSGSNEFLSFPGVASANAAGTPENFLDAANHILDFGGQSAIIGGMTRTLTQEVSN